MSLRGDVEIWIVMDIYLLIRPIETPQNTQSSPYNTYVTVSFDNFSVCVILDPKTVLWVFFWYLNGTNLPSNSQSFLMSCQCDIDILPC